MPSYDELVATRSERETELRRIYTEQMNTEIAMRLDQEEYLQHQRELVAALHVRAREAMRTLRRQGRMNHKVDIHIADRFLRRNKHGMSEGLYPLVAIVDPRGMVNLYYLGPSYMCYGTLAPQGRFDGLLLAKKRAEQFRDHICARFLPFNNECPVPLGVSNSDLEVVLQALEELDT
tara:strand:+ start:1575 stop:2105 length:531 start_codon:yes stop_codon:yes gene_type:complete